MIHLRDVVAFVLGAIAMWALLRWGPGALAWLAPGGKGPS